MPKIIGGGGTSGGGGHLEIMINRQMQNNYTIAK